MDYPRNMFESIREGMVRPRLVLTPKAKDKKKRRRYNRKHFEEGHHGDVRRGRTGKREELR